jgi:hypothetical protein
MGGLVELGHGRVLAAQAVAFTGSSAQATNPFGAQTYQVRIAADAACFVKVGNGAVIATATDVYLPANTIDYLMVSPGQSIAAIRAATDGLVTATSGTLNVVELG